MDFDPRSLTLLLPLLIMAGAGVLFGRFRAKGANERRARLLAWAASRNWQYLPSVPGLARRWESPPFGRGQSRSAYDVLAGEFRGRQVTSMTYEFVTGTGKDRSTHHFHVLAVHLPMALPWLRLTQQSGATSVVRLLGAEDIEFESAAFNDAWRVEGPAGQYAFDVIHPRMMERLMQPDAVGHAITIEGDDIFLYVGGSQNEEYIDGYLNLLIDVIENIPQHVWENAAPPQAREDAT